MSKCHCGARADLLIMLLETPDARSSESTWATCLEHLPEVMAKMSADAEANGWIIRTRIEKHDPYLTAWFLLDHCPWKLHGPEREILFQLARHHAAGKEWVTAAEVKHSHDGGSLTNVRENLNRPRVTGNNYDGTPKTYSLVESRERSDGHTVYRLVGWEGL